MKIRFRGVGEAQHIGVILEHPTCPQVGEEVDFGHADGDEQGQWYVRSVMHTPLREECDVYVVVGTPVR